jgi:hypothetical protein
MPGAVDEADAEERGLLLRLDEDESLAIGSRCPSVSIAVTAGEGHLASRRHRTALLPLSGANAAARE